MGVFYSSSCWLLLPAVAPNPFLDDFVGAEIESVLPQELLKVEPGSPDVFALLPGLLVVPDVGPAARVPIGARAAPLSFVRHEVNKVISSSRIIAGDKVAKVTIDGGGHFISILPSTR